jgi:hypothetical protein
MSNILTALVIESPDDQHPWGVSLEGHNPAAENFYPMAKEDAFRLSEAINKSVRWLDIKASGPPYDETVVWLGQDRKQYIGSSKEMSATHGDYWRINLRIRYYLQTPELPNGLNP